MLDVASEELDGAGDIEGVVAEVVAGVIGPPGVPDPCPKERGEDIAVMEESRLVPRSDGDDEDGGVETVPVVVPSERTDVTEAPVTETKSTLMVLHVRNFQFYNRSKPYRG